ncbi:MAG TPA: glycosyltransferase, partial [Rhodopila sp.]|nr:glycosyltransferase [Rhodopila sp.]
ADKAAFLGGARALLFPIDWPEPFGLVMIEAMACGTPVIAFRCGSVPEVIEHGVSGFIVENTDQAVEAVRHVAELNRLLARRAFDQRFTAEAMAGRYLEIYRDLPGTRTAMSARLVAQAPQLPLDAVGGMLPLGPRIASRIDLSRTKGGGGLGRQGVSDSLLRHRRDARLRRHCILRKDAPAGADGADQLAVDHNREAALAGDGARQ